MLCRDGASEPHEVLLSVTSTGLNFRDVLNVLGLYPGDPGPPGRASTSVNCSAEAWRAI